MIASWRLKNFKSVAEETELEFLPLTIFSGANNSGKSTVIQSILLTTQTIQNAVVERPVVLNGHMARLGSFTDLVSGANESKHITIGFSLSFPDGGDPPDPGADLRAARKDGGRDRGVRAGGGAESGDERSMGRLVELTGGGSPS